MSTQHDPAVIATMKRKKGDGSTIDLTCPQSIIDYNAHMGGVGLGDQYRKYYQVTMKLRKFYISG